MSGKSTMAESINGDLSIRVTVDTARMQWTPSPSRSVWRKRVHLVGPPERGQVTSVVRYEPHSSFPTHDHPGGEEIFVLDGIFSDEQGDWPAGTFLLNPEGFRHTPFSEVGCVIFVKLRQFAGRELLLDAERSHLDLDQHPGVEQLRANHRGRGSNLAEILAQNRPALGEVFSIGQDVVHAHDIAQGSPRLCQRRVDVLKALLALLVDAIRDAHRRVIESGGSGNENPITLHHGSGIADLAFERRT